MLKTLALTTAMTLCSMTVEAYDWQNDVWSQRSYIGPSGLRYKYDLSNPGDQIRYGLDIEAQIKDKTNADPRINIDRGLGGYGGGSFDPSPLNIWR